jgi:hypothetical protein
VVAHAQQSEAGKLGIAVVGGKQERGKTHFPHEL